MNGVSKKGSVYKQINQIILQTHNLHCKHNMKYKVAIMCFLLPTGPDFPTGKKNVTVKSIFQFECDPE